MAWVWPEMARTWPPRWHGDGPEMARSHSMLGVEIGVALTVMSIMFAIFANLSSRGTLKGGL